MSVILQRLSLRGKVWIFSGLLFVIIAGLGWLHLAALREQEDLRLDDVAATLTATVNTNLAAALYLRQYDFLHTYLQSLENHPDAAFFQVLNGSGERVYGFRDSAVDAILINFRRNGQSHLRTKTHLLLKQPLFYENTLQGYLISGFGKANSALLLGRARNRVLMALSALLLLHLLLTWLTARAVARPLQRLTALLAQQNPEDERFELRLSDNRGGETAQLGRAFNLLGESLDDRLKKVRHYEDYLDSFFSLSPLPILVTDTQGRIEKANEAAGFFFEQAVDLLESKTLADLLGSSDFAILKSHVDKSGDNIQGYITSLSLGKERSKVVELNLALLRDHTNEICNYLLFFVDVTEKMQTRHEILESQNRLINYDSELQQKSGELESAVERNRRNTRRLGRLIEVGHELIRCSAIDEILTVLTDRGSDLLEAEQGLSLVWRPEEKQLVAVRSFTADGLENLEGISENDGVLWRTFRDNQSYFLTERSLQARDFEELGIGSREACCVISVPISDREYKYGVAVFMHSQPKAFSIEDLHLVTALANQAAITMDTIYLLRELQQKAQRLEEANQELKGSQRQIVQLQKMESMGTLVGGIAHDFNNILGIILPNIDLIQLNHTGDRETEKRAAIIQNAAERAAKLTRQLLFFSRNQDIEVAPVALNALVRQVVTLLNRTLGKHVEVVMELQEGLPNVMADENQLIQVFMNLAVNARDAMPEGGRLLIRSESGRFELLGRTSGTEALVHISVTDSGEGIAPENLTNIFDPFFTTKSVGKGTGLGLSVVYGIIASHEGYIDVESETGKGTTFHLYFKPTTAPLENVEIEQQKILPGKGNILIVDDEELIRISLGDTLESLGYSVHAAPGGREAIDMLSNREDIQLVIVDFAMPHMNGMETIRALRKVRPDLKVMLSSGYASREELAVDNQLIDDFLPKPYHINELAAAVQDLLSGNRYSA